MGVAATLPELSEWTLTELMHYSAVALSSAEALLESSVSHCSSSAWNREPLRRRVVLSLRLQSILWERLIFLYNC